MGKIYKSLTPEDIDFIREQKLLIIGSASNAEVNVSPKGYDSIRILGHNSAVYLDYPGSANRTARDAAAGGEITVLFMSFDAEPRITRLFCKGEIIKKTDPRAGEYSTLFGLKDTDIIRQFILLSIYAVQRSCGFAVPIMDFRQERVDLKKWGEEMSARGALEKYIADHETPENLQNIP